MRQDGRVQALTGPQRVRLNQTAARPLAVASLLVVVIALGLFKPWGSGPSSGSATNGSSPARPAVVAAPTGLIGLAIAAPTSSLDPHSNISGPCYYQRAWRLFTVDTSSNGPVHTWYGLQPVQAAGPTDASIPVVPVHSRSLGQLGYCLMVDPEAPVHVVATRAWRLSAGEAQPIQLESATQPAPTDPDLGAIFLPPGGAQVSSAVWPAAVYVFEVQLGASPLSVEWFAAQVG